MDITTITTDLIESNNTQKVLIKDNVTSNVQLVETNSQINTTHSFEINVGQTADTLQWLRPIQTFDISNENVNYRVKIIRKVKTCYYRGLNFDNDKPDMIESYDRISFSIKNNDSRIVSIKSMTITIKKDSDEETFEYYLSKSSLHTNTFIIIPKNSAMFHDSEQCVERFYSKKYILCDEKLVQNQYKIKMVFYY